MRRPSLLRSSLVLGSLFLGACSFISPYSITFTNTSGEVIDPELSTLDFVVSAPTLAVISGVSCEGTESLDIVPVANKNAEPTTVHKLPLTLLKNQPAGVECEVTVTVYDKTTTSQASNSILLVMPGSVLTEEVPVEPIEPEETPAEPENIVEETPVEPADTPVESAIEPENSTVVTSPENSTEAEATSTDGVEAATEAESTPSADVEL